MPKHIRNDCDTFDIRTCSLFERHVHNNSAKPSIMKMMPLNRFLKQIRYAFE